MHAHHHHGGVDHMHLHNGKTKHQHEHFLNAVHGHEHYGHNDVKHVHMGKFSHDHKPVDEAVHKKEPGIKGKINYSSFNNRPQFQIHPATMSQSHDQTQYFPRLVNIGEKSRLDSLFLQRYFQANKRNDFIDPNTISMRTKIPSPEYFGKGIEANAETDWPALQRSYAITEETGMGNLGDIENVNSAQYPMLLYQPQNIQKR